MGKSDFPITPAIRVLRDNKISFEHFIYDYEEKGGTSQTAKVLNVDEHCVIKTLIMEGDDGIPFVVLMHGDREVSTKELGRLISNKAVKPCEAAKAMKNTGYQFGGTSPFGTKKQMNVFVEATIMDLDFIYINGGKRGFIVKIDPQDLNKVFSLTKINVAINK